MRLGYEGQEPHTIGVCTLGIGRRFQYLADTRFRGLGVPVHNHHIGIFLTHSFE